ncbi:hypothetical protein D3C81_810730 [compost metagenome]
MNSGSATNGLAIATKSTNPLDNISSAFSKVITDPTAVTYKSLPTAFLISSAKCMFNM